MDPLAFIVALARDAGALLCERFDDPREVTQKSPRDLVTDADRASEALIVERIRRAFPAASILGEESGVHAGTGDERFIVDPLDGTTNYAHRYPLFCVSIAYERAGVLEAGAVYAPVLDEMYSAQRGLGATCNGAPIARLDGTNVSRTRWSARGSTRPATRATVRTSRNCRITRRRCGGMGVLRWIWRLWRVDDLMRFGSGI